MLLRSAKVRRTVIGLIATYAYASSRILSVGSIETNPEWRPMTGVSDLGAGGFVRVILELAKETSRGHEHRRRKGAVFQCSPGRRRADMRWPATRLD